MISLTCQGSPPQNQPPKAEPQASKPPAKISFVCAPKVGEPYPDLPLLDRDGRQAALSSFKGLGNRQIEVGGVQVGPHRRGPDVIGSVGLRALRRLVFVLPAGRAEVILGFPRR